ncbi:MAG: 4,5-DOPA dioxygenase extradiol [Acidobacteria bacterium]|nr:4,5-DOPA dioxygenase extradiol [Acidobacteriota bacterium]
MTALLPAIFFGHGNPMNALQQNAWTEGWAELGRSIPRPKAVLCISAHWYVPETAVTAMTQPRTIHDFGGFPPELFRVEYPAPGDPALAQRVQALLAPLPVRLDEQWGLDHGTWAVLCHVFPQADVPLVQLSLDASKPAAFHYALGKQLAPLRAEGVLIVGSGNLVHNLRAYAWGQPSVGAYDWAARFEQQARALMLADDVAPLIQYEQLGRDALLSIPTPEHYLPLLYVLALRQPGEDISFPSEGMDGGSISMLTVRVG